MKITKQHRVHIARELQFLNTPGLLQEYRDAGLSDKRYRWDLLYKAGLSQWICDNIYQYADDDHLDTVLRNITNTH